MNNKIFGGIIIFILISVLATTITLFFIKMGDNDFTQNLLYVVSSILPWVIILGKQIYNFIPDVYLLVNKFRISKYDFNAKLTSQFEVSQDFNLQSFKNELDRNIRNYDSSAINKGKSLKLLRSVINKDIIILEVEFDEEQITGPINIQHDLNRLYINFHTTSGNIKKVNNHFEKLDRLIKIIEDILENKKGKYNINITFTNKKNPYINYVFNDKKLNIESVTDVRMKFGQNIYLYKNKLEINSEHYDLLLKEIENKLIKLDLNNK